MIKMRSKFVLAVTAGAIAVVFCSAVIRNNIVRAEDAAEKERHPRIHTAIKALKEARVELKEAAHDFGGHREEALKAVDAAIEQLETAKKFDKK